MSLANSYLTRTVRSTLAFPPANCHGAGDFQVLLAASDGTDFSKERERVQVRVARQILISFTVTYFVFLFFSFIDSTRTVVPYGPLGFVLLVAWLVLWINHKSREAEK